MNPHVDGHPGSTLWGSAPGKVPWIIKPGTKECPKCGCGSDRVSLDDLVELFKSAKEYAREEKMGVQPSSSFVYAMDPHTIDNYSDDEIVVDEYGREMTMVEFRAMLIGIKFHIKDSIGCRFS